MSDFWQNFAFGFMNGAFNRTFCSFPWFNFGSCLNNQRPTFFTPNYDFSNLQLYQGTMPAQTALFAYNAANYADLTTNFINCNYAPTYQKAIYSGTYVGIKKEDSKAKILSDSSSTTTPQNGAPFQPNISTTEYNQYNDLILKYAEQYDVDPNLVKAVIKQESRFNPNAGSGAGAKGLMQLMPATASSYGVTDVCNPEQNIKAGVKILSENLKKYKGDLNMVLAAYNWGPGNLKKKGFANRPAETRNYIPAVLGFYKEYQKSVA